MSDRLTDEQIERMIVALRRARQEELRTALATKNSFIYWLRNLGLHVLADKIANSSLWEELWMEIIEFLDYIKEKIEAVIDWIVENW